jgi:uncharacterized paraquat-inducible protein A
MSPQDSTRRCPRCLQPVPDAASRCPQCRVQVTKAERKLGLYAGIAGLIALLAIIGLALYIVPSESDSGASKTEQSAPAKKPPLN